MYNQEQQRNHTRTPHENTLPSDFKLEDGDKTSVTADAEFMAYQRFTPVKNLVEADEKKEVKYTGVVNKNLPEKIPEEGVILFLQSKGMEAGH